MLLLLLGITAEAAELKVPGALGMEELMEDLGPKFERATRHKLAITVATLGGLLFSIDAIAVVDRQGPSGRGVRSSARDGSPRAGSVQ